MRSHASRKHLLEYRYLKYCVLYCAVSKSLMALYKSCVRNGSHKIVHRNDGASAFDAASAGNKMDCIAI